MFLLAVWSVMLPGVVGPAAAQGSGVSDGVAALSRLTIDSTVPLDSAALVAAVRRVERALERDSSTASRASAAEAYWTVGERLVARRMAFALAARMVELGLQHAPADLDTPHAYLVLGQARLFQLVDEGPALRDDGSCEALRELHALVEATGDALRAAAPAAPRVVETMMETLNHWAVEWRACHPGR